MGDSLHPDSSLRRSSRLRPASRVLILLLLLSPLAFAVPHIVAPADPSQSAALQPSTVPTPATSATRPSTRPGAPEVASPAAVPRRTASIDEITPILGVALNCHHIGDLDLYLRSVDRIAELGANTLVVVTPMFQDRVDSSVIEYLPDKCPTDRQLITILRRARAAGLRTALQPIVLIENPGKADWRGVIQPANWTTWWASYDTLLDRFLRIANAAGVDVFCIGSELNTTEPQLAEWRRIAAHVRERFDGLITYSANWDRYTAVELWSLVDTISVSSYFELSPNNYEASLEKLIEAWAIQRDALTGFAATWRRPVVLSEVGYPSLPWAAGHPWNYVATGSPADHDAQARCYEAFFAAWTPEITRPESSTAGFFIYHWDPYHAGGRNDTGYGIAGKPAMNVVRDGIQNMETAGDRE